MDAGCLWVINTETRAASEAEARVRNRQVVSCLPSGPNGLPLLQVDSRLRGIRNALQGLYDALDFACLLFVPAEPELGRLVKDATYYHVEQGKLTPFHRSTLARFAERPFETSDLRQFLAAELAIACEQVVSIGGDIVCQGPEAVSAHIRKLGSSGKWVVIPDVTRPEHFATVISARKQLWGEKVLLAGSRTFLRDYFAAGRAECAGTSRLTPLSGAIDPRKRGAPLAVVCSLEPATDSQIAYAARALGPNLVTVVFDAGVVSADAPAVEREVGRAQQLVLQSLGAMRPVLLQSSRTRAAANPILQQELLRAIGKVVAGAALPRHLSSLLATGGQTAETIRSALGISAVEIKGALQASIPWGLPLERSSGRIPLVSKGGRLGREDILFGFFEQGHPLPRANILPVVTPLTTSGDIDEAGIEGLIRHLLGLGTTDLFAVGNAGEFRFLTNEQRLKALEVFARKAHGKLRVFAGVTGDTAEETRKNYAAASHLDVFAAVIMPLYFLESSQEIVPFVESLRPIQPGLPVVLYNNPERTWGQNISFEAAEALAFPVIALKDSSGDLARFDRYASALPVYQGQQRQFLEGYLHGARGAVGIIGHVSPLPNEFFAPTTTAARRAEIAERINELSRRVKQGGAEVAAYKFLLSLTGVMGDTVASREPARYLTEAQRELIRANNTELIAQGLALSSQRRHGE